MQSVVLLFPGQGSQAPGMGKDLAARFAVARDVFAAADDAVGASLSALCFDGPPEELTLTHNAQPALLTHGAAIWAVVRDALSPFVVAGAGHSLGEFSAYHAADSLALPEAVQLVRRRGELMYEAGVQRPGAMAAILGDLSIPIEEVCANAADRGIAVPANFNCPGQIVISGESAGVERAMELAKESGAKRAIKLNVSGAFHSPLMAFANGGLQVALDMAHIADSRFPIYSNVSAQPVTDAALARRMLLEQLTSPVQWTREIDAITSLHPDALYLEMGPGSVLKGLVKKIAPNVTVMPVGTADEVERLLGMVAA